MVHELAVLVDTFVCPDAVCLLGSDLGTPAHQALAAELFYDLANAYNIAHGQEYVLRALLAGDLVGAREISLGLDSYNAGLSLVQSALDRMGPLVAGSQGPPSL